MKAEELIKNNALQNIEVAGKKKVVPEEIALTAVSMARKEELPEKVELTKSEIAEKFGISIEQLVIKDD